MRRGGLAAINTPASMQVIRNPIRRTSAIGRRFIREIYTGWGGSGYFPDTRSHTRDSVHIYTCLASASARDLRKYSRAKEARENLSSPHRGSSIRAVGDGLSLAIACLHGELIYAHQPVSMFARTISLHGTRARVTFAPTVISQISSRAACTNSKSGI